MEQVKTNDTNDTLLMQELDNVDDLTKKLVNDVNRLCDEQDRMREEYKARQRKWFCVGIFFLIFATVCFVLSIALDKPNALAGVVLQLFAAASLIINNIDGFRRS